MGEMAAAHTGNPPRIGRRRARIVSGRPYDCWRRRGAGRGGGRRL